MKANSVFFHSEDDYKVIGYIRTTQGRLLLVYTTYYWGNGRATNRLVVLTDGLTYLGNYGKLDIEPDKVEGSTLSFKTAEGPTTFTTVDFSKGPPKKIYLEGEFYDFDVPK